jgi:hypothetical protein
MLLLLLILVFQVNSTFAYWTYEYLNVTQWQWQSCATIWLPLSKARMTDHPGQLWWWTTGCTSTEASYLQLLME